MPSLGQAVVSTAASLVLAPFLLLLCLILFPFAVLTTYFAFVALTVRAALVQAQVVAALIRRKLNIDDEYSSSAWTSRSKSQEREVYSRQRISRRQSLVNAYTFPTAIEQTSRTQSSSSSSSSTRTLTTSDARDGHVQVLDANTIPPISPERSRPPSNRSSLMLRDYEGVGGWYAIQSNALPGPEPESASLEWLYSNARLELPDADAASLTRPRTPEERKRSSSISGRSHRSMASLNRRSHERSATSGSIEINRSDETQSLRSNASRTSNQLERSRSGMLTQSHSQETDFVEGRRVGEGKNKSMILFGEKGSKFAYRLAGLKSLGMKKIIKGGTLSSPEESASEDTKHGAGVTISPLGKRRKSVSYDLGEVINGGNGSRGSSGPASVEGVDVNGGLTMWMSP